MRRLLACVLASASLPLAAQVPPPPRLEPLPEPPPLPRDAAAEPRVDIPVEEGDKVEEVRDGANVLMIKVTPKNGGKPYYLVNQQSGGNWIRRDSLDDGLRVPMWPLMSF